jgi:hypothetical protein
MDFAPPPRATFAMLDISMPKLLLGRKENDPTAWRILSDIEAGRTKRPQRKTEERFMRLPAAKVPGQDFKQQIEQLVSEQQNSEPTIAGSVSRAIRNLKN